MVDFAIALLLRQACFYDAGEKFNASLYDPTVQRFASYGTFRFIDSKFNVLDTAKQQLIGRLYPRRSINRST